jgi:hypothetical protein
VRLLTNSATPTMARISQVVWRRSPMWTMRRPPLRIGTAPIAAIVGVAILAGANRQSVRATVAQNVALSADTIAITGPIGAVSIGS